MSKRLLAPAEPYLFFMMIYMMTAEIIITNKVADTMMIIVAVEFLVFPFSWTAMSAVELEVVISLDGVVLSTCVSGSCIFKSVSFLALGFELVEKVVSVLPLFVVFDLVDTAMVFAVVVVVAIVVAVAFVSVVVVFIVVVSFVVVGAIAISCVVL